MLCSAVLLCLYPLHEGHVVSGKKCVVRVLSSQAGSLLFHLDIDLYSVDQYAYTAPVALILYLALAS